MTTATLEKPTVNGAAPTRTDLRNVYQRKLAVMKRCAEIKPDKVHPHHKFEYNSIQQVSNRMREFCVEEGLDASVDFDPERPGYTRVVLTNVDDLGDQITKYYPVTDGDKGMAYSTKYPIIRLFLIGDGEENEEAEMANKPTTAAPKSSQPAVQTEDPKRDYQDLGVCVICGAEGNKTRKGSTPHLYQSGNRPAQCNGIKGHKEDGKPIYAEHYLPISQADQDNVKQLEEAGDIDPDSIPF